MGLGVLRLRAAPVAQQLRQPLLAGVPQAQHEVCQGPPAPRRQIAQQLPRLVRPGARRLRRRGERKEGTVGGTTGWPRGIPRPPAKTAPPGRKGLKLLRGAPKAPGGSS